MKRNEQIKELYSEAGIDNFTQFDGTIIFYAFVKSIYRKFNYPPKVLDIGAGRGAWLHEDVSLYRREIRDLRNGAGHVVAADIDQAVLDNRASHKQVVCHPCEPLPFESEEFDVVVSDFVFEHVGDKDRFCSEVTRITKPGGWICARTPNRFGYVSLMSSIIPNRQHVRFLKRIQPSRQSIDVFPAYYKLNTLRSIRASFIDCDAFHYRNSAEPAYHFGSKFIHIILRSFHSILPPVLQNTICIFLRKKEQAIKT